MGNCHLTPSDHLQIRGGVENFLGGRERYWRPTPQGKGGRRKIGILAFGTTRSVGVVGDLESPEHEDGGIRREAVLPVNLLCSKKIVLGMKLK